ncbi:ExeA family protein [Sphingomonas pokkalii]|uniref:General secretion pathway protein n=1 Tax=Sphingomonas pokkalii TaxID=2175090 RepID=A0A2U0SHU3_9SPHN|nr:general secretion pathway protein [Sphingomonas pokkalii]PVX30894.1 general secretion pathway protein [Sphingomonas pokkalii]
MHDDYYGLREPAFQHAPDPRFWFETAAHGRAITRLRQAVEQGKGVVVVTGDVGMGKTILMRRLAGEIDVGRHRVHQIAGGALQVEGLLRLAAPPSGRQGGRTLLLIDDADALSPDCREILSQVSAQPDRSPVQLFLFGAREQPGGSVRRPATVQLSALAEEEVEPYLRHRLYRAGGQGRPGFTDEACRALHRLAGGVPRGLNQIVARLLRHGAAAQIDMFGAPDVAAAIEEMAADIASGASAAPADAGELRALSERVAELEDQLCTQQQKLRQVMQVLVDWLEQDEERRTIGLQALRDTLL